MKHKIHKVGIYVRLSKEDSREEESLSVENQKVLLVKHVQDNGWELIEIYCDDGFSGVNQERPALQKMLQDVKEGYINTILIKDLSRLGRNYLDVGNLAEIFLPEHGCELISLSEKVDEMTVFYNWFNEQYSRDASNKVKAVKEIYARNGKFMGATAPYGYKKSEANKHLLVADETASAVVREIFSLRSQGMGYSSITNHLNNTGIVPPRDYSYQGEKGENPYRISHKWCINTVRSILKNEAYIGNMVSLKQGTVSYKNRKITQKPEKSWVRAENTHEPLIEREIWDCVRDIEAKRYRTRTKSDGSVSIFCGLLYCSSCGFKMRSSTQKNVRKNGSQYVYNSFICGTYSRSGKYACSAHAIGEKKLHKIVLEQIQNHAKMAAIYEKLIIERISVKLYIETSLNCEKLSDTLREYQERMDKLDKLLEVIYEDKINEVISVTTFSELAKKYDIEYNECKEKAQNLEKEIRKSHLHEHSISKWVSLIKDQAELETIDAQTLIPLVERIIIGDALPGNTRIAAREVTIIYKYVGDLSWLGKNVEREDDYINT